MLSHEWAETVDEVVQDAKQGREEDFEPVLTCNLFVNPIQNFREATAEQIHDHVTAIMRELHELSVVFSTHPAALVMVHLTQLSIRQTVALCQALGAISDNIEAGTTLLLQETVNDSYNTPFTPLLIEKLNRVREAFGLAPLEKYDRRLMDALYTSALSMPNDYQILHLATMLRVFDLDALQFIETRLQHNAPQPTWQNADVKAGLLSQLLLDYLRGTRPDSTFNLTMERLSELGWPAREEVTKAAVNWVTRTMELGDVCATGNVVALWEMLWVIRNLAPWLEENPQVQENLQRLQVRTTPRTE